MATIARAGKGRFDDAKTAADLTRSVAAIAAAIKKPEPPKGDRPKLSPLDEALVEKLTDADWKVRKEACDGLAGRKCKEAASAVADFVASKLHNPLYETTGPEKSGDAAIEYFQAVAPDQTEAALARALRSPKAEVKAWAGRAVANLGQKQ